MNTIAIDCGASFIKAAYISNDKIIKKIEKSAPRPVKNDEYMETNSIKKLVEIVRDVLNELLIVGEDTILTISNEMHGFILVDENGNPYTDYISWQKEYGNIEVKGKSAVEILANEEYGEDILKTGMPLRAGLLSCNLLFLKNIGILDKKEKLYFYTLGDYLLRSLSQGEVNMHTTNAAATGLFDLKTGNWNEKLLKICSRINVVFPKISDERITFVYGSNTIVAFPAIGDQQAALLGTGIDTENSLSFNLGTGAQISKLEKKIILSSLYQTIPFFKNYYLKTIPHIPSGRAINVYIRLIQDTLKTFGISYEIEKIWEVILNQVKISDKSAMVFDMSFFENSVTDFSTGSILNIGEYDLSFGNLFRGIFEQLTCNYLVIAKKIQPDKNKIEKIYFSGGVARKIDFITENIIAQYPENCEIFICEDETLKGLNEYGKMLIGAMA